MDTQSAQTNRWELVIVIALSVMPIALMIPFILIVGLIGFIPSFLGLTPIKETAFVGALVGVIAALAVSAWCLLRVSRSTFSQLLVDKSQFGVAWVPATSKELALAGGLGCLFGIMVATLATVINLDVYPRGLPPMEVPSYLRWLAASVGVMLIVVFSPVYEEFVFRGLAISSMSRRWNLRVAVVGSSLLFAVSHVGYLVEQRAGIPIVLVLGFTAALLRVRHGSLESAIAFHAAYNLALVVLATFLNL